jgi:DNA-binding transcriptional MerR regulator
MLKQIDVIKICKSKFGIELTDRNFVFYRNEGFFSVKARENRFGLYDDDVPEKIALIKKLQDQGMKLKNIKKMIKAQDEKKAAMKEKKEIQKRMKALEGWQDPKIRLQKCIEVLGLDETDKTINIGMIGTVEGETVTFLSVFYGEMVDFFKFRVDLEKNTIELADKKTLTLDGLEMVMGMVLRSNLNVGKLLDADDIYLLAFYE